MLSVSKFLLASNCVFQEILDFVVTLHRGGKKLGMTIGERPAHDACSGFWVGCLSFLHTAVALM